MRAPPSLHSRGQMGLDLLVAMIILLVVLNALTPVLSRFEETQAEISIRQQLRSEAQPISLLLSSAANHLRESRSYPDSISLAAGTAIPAAYNTLTRFSGVVSPPRIRALHYAQGIDCQSTLDFSGNPGTLTLAVPSGTIGSLPVVEVESSFIFSPAFNSSWVDFTRCNAPARIGRAFP